MGIDEAVLRFLVKRVPIAWTYESYWSSVAVLGNNRYTLALIRQDDGAVMVWELDWVHDLSEPRNILGTVLLSDPWRQAAELHHLITVWFQPTAVKQQIKNDLGIPLRMPSQTIEV